MKIKQNKITNYGNAVEVRRHNRRILVKEYPLDQNDYLVEVSLVAPDTGPAARHKHLRNKVRVTGIRFTRTAMEDICTAFKILKNNQYDG